MLLHKAVAGFDRRADVYERGRPELPPAPIDFLVAQLRLGAAPRVLDLGAGTGKLTRLLHRRGLHIVALEPTPGMRRKLAETTPGAAIVGALADAIPLRAGSMNAAVAANAFHWFATPLALAEISRILAPGGRLGLLWSERAETARWVTELRHIVEAHRGDAPRHRDGTWKLAFAQFGGFREVGRGSFPFVQVGGVDLLVNRVASMSVIAALPEAEHQRVLEQVRELLRSHPETRGRERLELPYRAEVFIYEAAPQPR